MKFILNYINNSPIKNQKGLDYIFLSMRRGLLTLLGGSFVIFLIILLLTIFKVQLELWLYITLFVFLFSSIFLSLWLGIWNTQLTSREMEKPFSRDRMTQGERSKNIKFYAIVSFIVAIINSVSIIFLTLNNFIISLTNQMYDNAENYLKYGDSRLSLETFRPLIGNQFWNTLLLIAPILFFVYLLYSSYNREIFRYYSLIEDWLKSRFYRDPIITPFIIDLDNEGEAFLVLGKDANTGEDIIIKPETRVLNTALLGATGTGKSAAVANNVAIQDTQNLVHYLKQFGSYVRQAREEISHKKLTKRSKEKLLNKKIDEWFDEGMGKNLLNGFYFNEPAGNLIASVENILRKSGIPREMILVIDPSRKDTESINIFDNDAEYAAGQLSNLIRTFAEEGGGGNTFFENAEQTFVRNLVFMLKTTSQIENNYLDRHLHGGSPTLADFAEMLDISEKLVQRVNLLKVFRDMKEREFLEEVDKPYQEKYNLAYKEFINNGGVPARFDNFMPDWLRKEQQIHRDLKAKFDIINTTYHYFADNYYEDERTGIKGFRQEANVEGMKNTIRILSNSPMVRRIFFNQSSKDVRVIMKTGGVILVNSARGPLDTKQSKMVGQITDLIVQQGAFNRLPEISPLFPFIGDEHAWVVTGDTENFANQNRKFRTPILNLYQNYDQVEDAVGTSATEALFQSYRNLFVFQGGSRKSMQLVIDRAGKSQELIRSFTNVEDDILAGKESNATSFREEKREVDKITEADLFRQEKFGFSGVYVENDEESEVVQVVPTPYFKQPIIADKNFKPLFDIENNPEDRDDFEIWKEQTERFYLQKIQEEIIPLSKFTEEEKKVILGEYLDETSSELVETNENKATKDSSISSIIKESNSDLNMKESDEIAKNVIANNRPKKDIAIEDSELNSLKTEKLETMEMVSSDDLYTIRQGEERQLPHSFNDMLK